MAISRNEYSREQYWRALGKFVDQFSRIEIGLHLLLQERARMPLETAQALLSGVRVDQAVSSLRRLARVYPPPQKIADDQEYIFSQLRVINDIRNLIIHYGADTWVEPGVWLVWDWLTALDPNQIRKIRVSSKLLLDLTRDLRKIQVHLSENHLWREEGLPSPYSKRDLALLNASWRYIPPKQQKPQKRKKGRKTPRNVAKTYKPPPRPSRG